MKTENKTQNIKKLEKTIKKLQTERPNDLLAKGFRDLINKFNKSRSQK